MDLSKWIFWAGIAQLAMTLASIGIPYLLDWKKSLSLVPPLFGQIFKTYSAYVFGTNLWMGMVCVLMPASLIDGGALAKAVSIYAALYWIARVAIQFFYYNRKGAPKGLLFDIGEILLVSNFVFLSVCYMTAVYVNFII